MNKQRNIRKKALMSPFIIPISVLFFLVLIVVTYGILKGGVDKMLENEIEDNDINASKRLETARFIDFFHQVKRVDSVYINESNRTLQYKKNNRLSEYFHISNIKIVNVYFNSKLFYETDSLRNLPLEDNGLDLLNGDIAIMIDTDKIVLNIIFDGYEKYKELVLYFQSLEI